MAIRKWQNCKKSRRKGIASGKNYFFENAPKGQLNIEFVKSLQFLENSSSEN